MAPEVSQSLLLWVCGWIVCKEGDFVKGVTIQTDSEFLVDFFVKSVKFVKYSGSQRLSPCLADWESAERNQLGCSPFINIRLMA